ncbi:MAG: hypothetical protein KDC34_18135 [Saprospiraceae bacterium]|nr:hypothetical protein [Saprospiraceae bacterium]
MKNSKLIYWIIALAVLGLVAWAAYEITTWQNLLGLGNFPLWACLAGGITGLFVANRVAGTFDDSIDRIRVLAFSFFGGLILFLALSSFMNRVFAGPSKSVPVAFVKQEAFGASRFGLLQDSIKADGYYLYFQRPNKPLERIRLRYPYPTPPQEGDQITLPIRKGLFGIEIVDLE